MQPVQITIRDIPNSPVIEQHLRKKAQKLTQFYQRINSCKIVLTFAQKHKHQGKLFTIHIDLIVPGKELVVNRKFDEDVYVAIRDAFKALERQLESYVHKRKGHVKTHELANKGEVARIFYDEGYGFIQGVDGNEYYFSAANICYPTFQQLQLGDRVEYLAISANDGFQANHVKKEKYNNH